MTRIGNLLDGQTRTRFQSYKPALLYCLLKSSLNHTDLNSRP